MRIHKLYQCLAAATLLFLPVACDNTDYSENHRLTIRHT